MSNLNRKIGELEATKTQRLTIDSACNGEYTIYYEVHPTEPEKNQFVFKGIQPGTIFPKNLCMSKNIKEIYDYIKTTYPKMTTAKWEKLGKLREKAVQTSIRISTCKNEQTEKENDEAIEKLTDFETENGL